MPPVPEEEALRILLQGQNDPEWWISTILGDSLWSKQREIVESVRDYERTAVRSCHGMGKSWVAARIALWFLNCFPGSIVVTTAPTFRQVAKITWQEIRVAWKNSKCQLEGQLNDVGIKMDEKWYAMGFTATDPDSFQGIHAPYVLIILEEASGIEHDIWIAADGCLTSAHCRLLSVGNPTDPTGQFFKEFRTPGVNKIRVSAFDTPNLQGHGIVMPGLITEHWVEDKRRRWGEDSPMWQSRVMADFPEITTNTLIPLAWAERAARMRLDDTPIPNELGCDVARFGDDETTIYHLRGQKLRLHSATRKEDTMSTVGRLVQAQRETGAEIIKVDDSGVGGGVTDRLKELAEQGTIKCRVYGFVAGSTAIEERRFANKRAEVAWVFRERLQENSLQIDDDEELHAQLSAIKYKMTSQGKIMLEDKAITKKTLGCSPDRSDGAFITLATVPPGEDGSVQVW